MGGIRLAIRRLVAQRLLALGLLVCMSFTIGVVASGPIYASAASRAVVVGLLERTSPLVTALEIRAFTSQHFDPAAADRTVRRAVGTRSFRMVVQQVETPPLLAEGPNGTELLTTMATRQGVFGDLHLVAGHLPTGPGQVLVDVQDASRLGVYRPGPRLVLRSGRSLGMRIVGIYQPTDRDPLVSGRGRLLYQSACQPFSQGASCSPGPPLPVLVTGAGFDAVARRLGLDQNLSVQWDALLRASPVTAADLPTIVRREHALVGRLRQVPGLGYDLTGRSRLASLVGPARRAAAAATAAIDLVVVAVAAVALAVVVAIASLLVARQSLELSILKSRGARRRHLLGAQALQAVCAAVAALPVGLGFAIGLATLARLAHGPSLAGVPFPISLSGSAVLTGLVAAAASVLVVLAASWRAASRSIVAERRAAGRTRRAGLLALPLEAVFLLAGGLAFVELRRRGLAPDNGSIDPLVLLAPTLLLFGGAILVVRAFLWAMRSADRLVGHLRSLPAFLAARRIARAPDLSLALVLLLLVSMGLFVTASSLRATVLTASGTAAWQATGGDWRVAVAAPAQPLEVMRRLPAGATPLYEQQVAHASVADLTEGTLVGIDPATYADGGAWPAGTSSLGEGDLLGRLAAAPTGILVPKGTTAIRAVLRADRVPKGLRLEAALERPAGGIVGVDLGTLHDGTAVDRASVGGAGRLLALDLVGSVASISPAGVRLVVRSLSLQAGSTTRPLSLEGWQPLYLDGSGGTVGPAPGAQVAATLYLGSGTTLAGLVPADPPLPALLSPGLGSPSGSQRLTVSVDGLDVPLRPVGSLDSFPGLVQGQSFVVVPEAALLTRLDRTLSAPRAGMNTILAMGGGSPLPAIRTLGFTVHSVHRAATLEAAMAAKPGDLAMGMEFSAAVGAVALVVVGLGLAASLGQRRRDFEVAVLRGAGVGTRTILAAAVGEQACLVAFSLAASVALGLGLLRLVLPFVQAGISGSAGVAGVLLDWPAFGIAALCTVAASALGVALGAGRSLRATVTAVLRGEPE